MYSKQSQKRKQDLLAEMLLEEQRGRELSKIVKELLPDSKNSSDAQKPSQARMVWFSSSILLNSKGCM